MSAFWEHLPYLAIFFWLLAAGLGFPVPEDLLLLTGGYLCYEGHARLSLMMIVGFVGVLAGDCFLYTMGHIWGVRIVEHRIVRRMITRKRLLLAEQLFHQHGIKILFFGRFLPGLRPVIYATAGVLRVPPLTFAVVNGLAASISVPIFVLLGNYFGHNIEQIERDVRTATHLILFTVLVIILIIFMISIYRRQRRMLAEVEDLGPPSLTAVIEEKPRDPSPPPSSPETASNHGEANGDEASSEPDPDGSEETSPSGDEPDRLHHPESITRR